MKTKNDVIQAYASLLTWVESLQALDDHLWLHPIQEGKWSIAEIISHLMYWDRYVADERLPIMKPGTELNTQGVDVEAINARAAQYARSVSREVLIGEWIKTRNVGVQRLEELSDETFFAPFQINGKSLTVASYVEGLIKHDKHHQAQAVSYLQDQE